MVLYAKDMFFRGDNEKQQSYDRCIHGKVVFRIGEHQLSDDAEWCVSASAYRFLHTLFENHFMGAEDFLIPCCGHTMIPSKSGTSVSIIGCNNGIDFTIIHKPETVSITTADNREYSVSFADYRDAILSFAKQAMDFYQANPPRKFESDFDKEGYDAFVAEYHSLYNKATALTENISPSTSIRFADYDCYSEEAIAGIGPAGISLNPFGFINFKECAYNFKQIEGGSGEYIGESDLTDLSVAFYTSPKPTVIKFTAKRATTHLRRLQKQISKFGYSTRDIS